MFNIHQDITDTGPSDSAETQDEQDVASLSNSTSTSPAIAGPPQMTPDVHDPSTTADNQPQSDQHTDTVAQQNATATQDQLPSLIMPTQLSVESAPNIVKPTPSPIATSTSPRQDNPIQTAGTERATTVPAVHAGGNLVSDSSLVHSQPTTINPSLLVEPVSPIAQIGAGGSNPSGTDPKTLFALPEVSQVPIWMKKKGTIEYFNSTSKTDDLSGLISNWLKLEHALGFPEQVSLIPLNILENELTFHIR